MKRKLLLWSVVGLSSLCGPAVAQDATIGPAPEIVLPKEGAVFTGNVPISIGFPWGVDWWGWLSQTYFKGSDPKTITIAVREELKWCPPPAPPGGAWPPPCKTIHYGGSQHSALQLHSTGMLNLSGSAGGFASLLGIQGGAGKYAYRVQFLYSAGGKQAAQPSPWSNTRNFVVDPIKSIARGGVTAGSSGKPLAPALTASRLTAPTIEQPRERSVLSSALGPFNLTIRPSVAARNYCPGGNYEYSCQYAPPTKPGEWPQYRSCSFSGLLICDSAEQARSFPIINPNQYFKPGYYKLKVRHRKNGKLGTWSAERAFSIVQSGTGTIPGAGQNGSWTQHPATSTHSTTAPALPAVKPDAAKRTLRGTVQIAPPASGH